MTKIGKNCFLSRRSRQEKKQVSPRTRVPRVLLLGCFCWRSVRKSESEEGSFFFSVKDTGISCQQNIIAFDWTCMYMHEDDSRGRQAVLMSSGDASAIHYITWNIIFLQMILSYVRHEDES